MLQLGKIYDVSFGSKTYGKDGGEKKKNSH